MVKKSDCKLKILDCNFECNRFKLTSSQRWWFHWTGPGWCWGWRCWGSRRPSWRPSRAKLTFLLGRLFEPKKLDCLPIGKYFSFFKWSSFLEQNLLGEIEMHLRRGVAEALKLDLAHLPVDWVPVKVHVASHVVVYPRRVSKNNFIPCVSVKLYRVYQRFRQAEIVLMVWRQALDNFCYSPVAPKIIAPFKKGQNSKVTQK